MARRVEAQGERIYSARFVDEIKQVGTPNAKHKSRLVVQAFNDDAQGLLTYAPTVQRVSQRIALHCAAMDSSLKVFFRDITQAYTQACTPVLRRIYVKPPACLDLGADLFLRVE